MINYDADRGVRVANDQIGSTLTLENARADADSGNYTCSPYNIRPSSVIVHVLGEGNSAAAVQNSNDGSEPLSALPGVSGVAGSGGAARQPPSAAVQSNRAAPAAAKQFSSAVMILLLLAKSFC
jgi:hypothetical protein